MATYYPPGLHGRRSSFSNVPRPSVTSYSVQRRPVYNPMSAIRGVSEASVSSTQTITRASPTIKPEILFSSPSTSSQFLGYTRSRVVLKTCDSHPVITPQLEDRLLQLADRSRRLGAHRFSRTRNSLVLNDYPQSIPPCPIPMNTVHRYPRISSSTSSSSASGSKLLLPRVGGKDDRTSIRE
jgi:hypothetical protein